VIVTFSSGAAVVQDAPLAGVNVAPLSADRPLKRPLVTFQTNVTGLVNVAPNRSWPLSVEVALVFQVIRAETFAGVVKPVHEPGVCLTVAFSVPDATPPPEQPCNAMVAVIAWFVDAGTSPGVNVALPVWVLQVAPAAAPAGAASGTTEIVRTVAINVHIGVRNPGPFRDRSCAQQREHRRIPEVSRLQSNAVDRVVVEAFSTARESCGRCR
jgi:hypothetical protein